MLREFQVVVADITCKASPSPSGRGWRKAPGEGGREPLSHSCSHPPLRATLSRRERDSRSVLVRFVRRSTVIAFLFLASIPGFAQMNIEGEWAGRYHEDQGDRVPGDVQGDFTGVPLNDAARRYAEAFDVTRVN